MRRLMQRDEFLPQGALGLLLAFLVFSFSACGGGREMPYSEDPGLSPGPPMEAFAYVPFVEQVTIPDAIIAGQPFRVDFEIGTPGLPDRPLYFPDTSEDPVVIKDGVAQIGRLYLYFEPTATSTLYYGSGRITVHVLPSLPGGYELVYEAASSPGDAGVYDAAYPTEEHTNVFTVPFEVE